MSLEQLKIQVTRRPDRLVLAIDGELDLVSSGRLEPAVEAEDLDGLGAVVLDLGGVRFLDSAGLRAIFRVRKVVQEQGRRFAVTQASPQVQRLLSVTRLDEHLETIETADASLA